MNFEDARGDCGLFAPDEQISRIEAMRDAADAAGVPLVINARTDVFLKELGENDAWRLEESVRRCNAYLKAGADSAFVPGVADEHLIERLAASIAGPLNVLAGATSPNVRKLAELGVARISVGSASICYAMAKLREAALAVQQTGSFDFARERISHANANELFD